LHDFLPKFVNSHATSRKHWNPSTLSGRFAQILSEFVLLNKTIHVSYLCSKIWKRCHVSVMRCRDTTTWLPYALQSYSDVFAYWCHLRRSSFMPNFVSVVYI